MTTPGDFSQPGLPRDVAERLDLLCDAFEKAWRAGDRPSIDSYVGQGTDAREQEVLARELARLELELRESTGETMDQAAYQRRHSARQAPRQAQESDRRAPSSSTRSATPGAGEGFGGRPLGSRIGYVGDYELLEEIGRGGMGIVYRARQTSLGRQVAVKLMLPSTIANATQRERFRREAQHAARLDHPHIVPVYEVGEDQGQIYFSMGFVTGGNLKQRQLQDGPWNPRAAALLLSKVARAIEYAHGQKVIHRDLKPDNILLDTDGEPHITDFGLAKNLREESGLTLPEQVMGTPSYMAPEQATAQLDIIGPETDVYALGAVLYYLVSGRAPFLADNFLETLRQVRETEPVSLERLNPAVPADLGTIVTKCLAKTVEGRYRSAGDLADDLDRFTEGHTIAARSASVFERAWRWSRRNRALAAALSAAVLFLLLGVAGSTWFGWSARQQAILARDHQQEAETFAKQARDGEQAARELADEATLQQRRAEALADQLRVTAAQQSERRLYAARVVQAQTSFRQNSVQQARQLLTELRTPRVAGEDYRGFEWHQLWHAAHAEIATSHQPYPVRLACAPRGQLLAIGGIGHPPRIVDALTLATRHELLGHQTTGSQGVFGLTFSHDGRWLATAGNDGTARLWDVANGQQVASLEPAPPTASFRDIAFSPDDTQLAIAGLDGQLYLWDRSSGKVRWSAHCGNLVLACDFAADGESVAAGTSDGTIQLFAAADGQLRHRLTGHTLGVTGVAFAPRGSTLASSSLDNTVVIWDLAKPQALARLTGHEQGVSSVLWLDGGTQLATAGGDGTIRVWDAERHSVVATYRGHAGEVASLAVSPAGDRLYSCSTSEQQIRVWDPRRDPEGSRMSTLGVNIRLAFTPDGQRLVSAAGNPMAIGAPGEIVVWNAETGHALSRLGSNLPCQTAVGIAPDGRWAVAAGVDGVVRVFDLQTYAEVRTLAEPTPHVQALEFVPDRSAVVLASGHRHEQNQPGVVRLFNLQTGERLHEVSFPVGVFDLLRHPDGRWFVGLANGTIAVLDPQLNPTGERWEQHQGAVQSLALSPDGTRLASASWDQTVKLWDTRTGEQLENLTGHFDVVSAVSFSPDGARLASCAGNPYATSSAVATGGAVKLWDVGIGQEVWNAPGWEVARWITIRRSQGVTTALVQPTWTYAADVAFSPDGTRLAAAFRDGTVRLWLGMPSPGGHNR